MGERYLPWIRGRVPTLDREWVPTLDGGGVPTLDGGGGTYLRWERGTYLGLGGTYTEQVVLRTNPYNV